MRHSGMYHGMHNTQGVRNNKIDWTVTDKKEKKVVLLEMICPWVSNREIKCAEKTSKYALLQY